MNAVIDMQGSQGRQRQGAAQARDGVQEYVGIDAPAIGDEPSAAIEIGFEGGGQRSGSEGVLGHVGVRAARDY
jgi:hypothetical protein